MSTNLSCSSPSNFATRLRALPFLLGCLLYTSPAFAGTSGSTMGQGVTSMFQDIIDFMTGPIVVSIATIAFLAALAGMYFSGGADGMKKVLSVVAVTAGIIAGPGIVMQVVNAAGAVV